MKATTGGFTVATPTTATASGNKWTAQTIFTAKDNNGVALAGAIVNVKIRYYTKDGNGTYQWQDAVTQATTTASGAVTIYSDVVKNGTGTSSVSQIQFVIESVQMPNNLGWDQKKSTVTASAP